MQKQSSGLIPIIFQFDAEKKTSTYFAPKSSIHGTLKESFQCLDCSNKGSDITSSTFLFFSQNHFIIFFQKTCYHGNHIMHSVVPPNSKAIVLLREQVGEIFSNSYITCYQERSSKYPSLKKFCRADETKNLLFDYCVSNFLRQKTCIGEGEECERALDDVFGIWVTVRSCCEKRIETKLCKSR